MVDVAFATFFARKTITLVEKSKCRFLEPSCTSC